MFLVGYLLNMKFLVFGACSSFLSGIHLQNMILALGWIILKSSIFCKESQVLAISWVSIPAIWHILINHFFQKSFLRTYDLLNLWHHRIMLLHVPTIFVLNGHRQLKFMLTLAFLLIIRLDTQRCPVFGVVLAILINYSTLSQTAYFLWLSSL